MSYSRIWCVLAVAGLASSSPAGLVLYVDSDSTAGSPSGTSWGSAYSLLRDAMDHVHKSGTHTGLEDVLVLTDSTQSWDADELIGFTVYNITDESWGTITDNTATTVTATLEDGEHNDWDTGDSYEITHPQIWVSGGPFYPDEGAEATDGNRAETFYLRPGLAIYGGFAGREDYLSERPSVDSGDPDTLSVLTGDIDKDGVVDNDNTLHIVSGSHCDRSAVLDGFHIKDGFVNILGDPGFPNGAGLAVGGNDVDGPTIRNCRFEDNIAERGAGAYIYKADTLFENCWFEDNYAGYHGGAVRTSGSDDDSPIRGDTIFLRCTFVGNVAGGTGTDDGGGAIHASNCAPTILNCRFYGNKAGESVSSLGKGGAIHVHCDESTVSAGAPGQANGTTVTNSVFSGNLASHSGGAMWNDCPDPVSGSNEITITNGTFSHNNAYGNSATGGGIRHSRSTLTVRNSIFWGNIDQDTQTTDETAQITPSGGTIDVKYACVDNDGDDLVVYTDASNTKDNPRLINFLGDDGEVGTPDDNLRLAARVGSSASEAGDNESLPADSLDLDGDGNTTESLPLDLDEQSRRTDDPDTADPQGETSPVVDMGAYEYFRDCNSNGVPDVDETAVVEFEGMRSCRDHADASDTIEYCLKLTRGNTTLNTEPRLGGIEELEIYLDICVDQVTASVSCDDDPYTGTITSSLIDADRLRLSFSPALPQGECCTLTLGGDADDTYLVSSLEGDVNQDKIVNTIDFSTIKTKFADPVDGDNFKYDVNRNLIINSIDSSTVKARFGDQTPQCP